MIVTVRSSFFALTTSQLVLGRIDSRFRIRRWWRCGPQEEKREELDRIAQIERAVVVCVRGVLTSGCRRSLEEMVLNLSLNHTRV